MLELQNITFGVQEDTAGSREILRDINLRVEKGIFLAITGPNGGGKSTLAKIIMGIERPTSGKILFEGIDITNKSISERANLGIGFALQQPVRFKGLTVHDLLSLAAKEDLNVTAACKYLSEVGLCANDYVNRELNASLSGGELKRIEIAMQIARGPKLSVLDEPEAGIDLWSFQNLVQVFENMHNTTTSSMIIISHQERILEIADEIVVISEGHIAVQGTRQEILPKLLECSCTCEFQKRVQL